QPAHARRYPRAARELGDDGDADAGGDEGGGRVVVLRLDGVARAEAGGRAGAGDEALGDPGGDVAADPRLLGELDHRDRASAREPVAGGYEGDEGVAHESSHPVARAERLAGVVGHDVEVDGRGLAGRVALGED